jgi:hypothetical protein
MQNINPYIGWVPFPYFQYILISLLLLSYTYYKKINEILDKYFYNNIKYNKLKDFIKLFISLIPIVIILYLDLNYNSFSMESLGITKYISNEMINIFFNLMGGYCLIQVAAQDIGIKTGTIQSDFIKLPIIQFFLYSGVANMATQNRSLAIIASLLYFQMKYFVSSGITKDVCFD